MGNYFQVSLKIAQKDLIAMVRASTCRSKKLMSRKLRAPSQICTMRKLIFIPTISIYTVDIWAEQRFRKVTNGWRESSVGYVRNGSIC